MSRPRNTSVAMQQSEEARRRLEAHVRSLGEGQSRLMAIVESLGMGISWASTTIITYTYIYIMFFYIILHDVMPSHLISGHILDIDFLPMTDIQNMSLIVHI